MIRGAFATTSVGKQDAVERAVANAELQRVELDGAIQSQQSADAQQREPVAQLDRDELRDDDQDEREAVPAVGKPRRQDADRAHRDELGEGQFQRAGVFALFGFEAEEATALEAAGVDRQADARGRLEVEGQIGGSQVAAAARKAHARDDAESIDRREERTEARAEGRRHLDRQRATVHAETQVERLEFGGPDACVHRNRDLGAGSAKPQAVGGRPAAGEPEGALGMRAAGEKPEERIPFRRVDHGPAAIELRFEPQPRIGGRTARRERHTRRDRAAADLEPALIRRAEEDEWRAAPLERGGDFAGEVRRGRREDQRRRRRDRQRRLGRELSLGLNARRPACAQREPPPDAVADARMELALEPVRRTRRVGHDVDEERSQRELPRRGTVHARHLPEVFQEPGERLEERLGVEGGVPPAI